MPANLFKFTQLRGFVLFEAVRLVVVGIVEELARLLPRRLFRTDLARIVQIVGLFGRPLAVQVTVQLAITVQIAFDVRTVLVAAAVRTAATVAVVVAVRDVIAVQVVRVAVATADAER